MLLVFLAAGNFFVPCPNFLRLYQSFFLKYASDAFKRAVALDIETKILMDGEKVYEQGKEINTVVYVSSGSLRIHSAQDNESTILTLGIGTLLGENCLVCGCKSPVKVKNKHKVSKIIDSNLLR